MRFLLSLTLLAVLAPTGLAQDDKKPQLNEELVKEIRGALSAKRKSERDEAFKKILARNDLDWPSVKEALMKGPYHQKPLVTQYGERHSGKHLGVRLTGVNGQERGFSFFVPKAYDAKKKLPMVVYLHHSPADQHIGRGMDRAAVAVTKFKKVCDDYGIFFCAPYTNKGAEWWTDGGEDLVKWSIRQMKKAYNLDENRIALMGALGGADAVWYLGQTMPGTFSALLPMTGDPYEITGMIRPLSRATLDRVDIFMGIPGRTKSTVGTKDVMTFLNGLKPMFEQRMRITTAVFPRSDGDFHYLEDIQDRIANFIVDRERSPLAIEVDVETTGQLELQSLWLTNHGYDPKGAADHRMPDRILHWQRKLPGDPQKKIGISARDNDKWEIGVQINRATGAAQQNNLFPGDVILEVDGVPIKKMKDIGPLVNKHDWDDEVHVLIAREVKEDDLEREKRNQAMYMKVRAKIAELKAKGEKVPSMRDLRSMVEDDEEDDAGGDEDDEEVEFDFGDEDDGKKEKVDKGGDRKGFKRPKTAVFVFERWLRLRKPGVPLMYHGFGLAQDNSYRGRGVRVAWVYPGSLPARSGFKPGDVITQMGDTEVKSSHDIQKWLKSSNFKFEKEPEGERFVEFTVQAHNNQNNSYGAERTVRVEWKPLDSSRVDVRWNKKENTCNVLVRHCKGFTLYFTDELIAPNKDFHLFINDIAYQDLVDPATAPKYPRHGFGDRSVSDRVYRLRRTRALVKGWTPDPKVAIEEFRKHQDRELVVGAKRSFDLSALHEGFKAAKERSRGGFGAKKGKRVKKAYDEHKSQG